MSRFTKILTLSPLPDGRSWVLREDFGYAVGAENSDDIIDVPAGFITDLASMPRPLWSILPRWGRYGNAAIIHDWLYWQQSRSRAESDRIFREAMRVLGVSKPKELLIYYGVRLVGYIGWWIDKTAKEQGFRKVIDVDELDTVLNTNYSMPSFWSLIWQKLGMIEE